MQTNQWTIELLHAATGLTWTAQENNEFSCVFAGTTLTLAKASYSYIRLWGANLDHDEPLEPDPNTATEEQLAQWEAEADRRADVRYTVRDVLEIFCEFKDTQSKLTALISEPK